MTGLIIAVVAVALVVAALTIVAVRRWLNRPVGAITLTPNLRWDGEQYTARTPAGPAVVTRVWSDEHGGESYELETDFHGPRRQIRLYYSPPHLRVALRDLAQHAADHLARQEAARG